jgi:uncharacterized protein (DUF1499 family)
MKSARAVSAIAALLCVAALVTLGASGPGTRLGAWHWTTGLAMFRWTVYLAGAGAAIALVALLVPKLRNGRVALLAGALVASLAAAAVPLGFARAAGAVPPIHDITTDMDDPPRFSALLPLREGARNPPEYAGRAVADQQRAAYPDIQPLVVGVPVSEAFARAQRAASAHGWQIVAADPASGRLEAVATTSWFGFRDDVVVRVAPAGTGGSRVDVRSKSRVGRSDLGANAKRVRRFLASMKEAS